MTDNRILLVEDNPDDAELTVRAFRRSNLANELDVVRDGAEALAYLFGEGEYATRDLRDQPQVVLLDLKLPKVSGIEVLRRIRNNPRTALVPVVILTSSDEEEDVLQSYRLGANSYLRKPVDFHRFVDAVQNLGLYWLVLNRGPSSPP